MLRLFESIFGKADASSQLKIPRELLDAAIERTVDATDPRLRAIAGYHRKLEGPVSRAIEHVVALVDAMPPSVELSTEAYGREPSLSCLFASAARMGEIINSEPNLRRVFTKTGVSALYALLLMEREEKHVLASELRGDVVVRDTLQTTVSFTNHRFLDLEEALDVHRRLLRRRAFDHLLQLALEALEDRRERRLELDQQRILLRRKLALLRDGQWGFDSGGSGGTQPDAATVEAVLSEIEHALTALGPRTEVLQRNLDLIAETLNDAPKQFWTSRAEIVVDQLGFKRAEVDATSQRVQLHMLHNANGRSVIALPVRVSRSTLESAVDLATRGERALGA